MSNEKKTKYKIVSPPPPFSNYLQVHACIYIYIPVADWSFLYSDTKADTSSNHVIYTFPVNKIYKQIIKKKPTQNDLKEKELCKHSKCSAYQRERRADKDPVLSIPLEM